MKSISWETAELMMKTAAFIYCKCFVNDDEDPEMVAEEANDFACNVFTSMCDVEGIDEVEDPPEEGKEEEEEENLTFSDLVEFLNGLI